VRQNETITGLYLTNAKSLAFRENRGQIPVQHPACSSRHHASRQANISYFCSIGGKIDLFSRLRHQKCDALSRPASLSVISDVSTGIRVWCQALNSSRVGALLRLSQRDDLVDSDQRLMVETVGPQANPANIESAGIKWKLALDWSRNSTNIDSKSILKVMQPKHEQY
jgi:hypothetical protein